jgi:hypothetical protein
MNVATVVTLHAERYDSVRSATRSTRGGSDWHMLTTRNTRKRASSAGTTIACGVAW